MSISLDDVARMSPAQQESIRRQLAAQSRPLCPSTDTKLFSSMNTKPPVPELVLVSPTDEKARKQVVNRERAEQIELFDRIRACLDDQKRPLPGREGAQNIFALANENSSGSKGIGILRWKMGVGAGLPDIGVFVPRQFRGRTCAGLFIEMKCSDGTASDVRQSQEDVMDALAAAGYEVFTCYGCRRAWSALCEYLGWE
jgi:hypothetical protein